MLEFFDPIFSPPVTCLKMEKTSVGVPLGKELNSGSLLIDCALQGCQTKTFHFQFLPKSELLW
jgi:hypothetical protein